MRIPLALVLVACTQPPSATVPVTTVIEATRTVTIAPLERTDLSPPFTLTASDGSGLQLVRVEAKAVIQGPLALTELHLVFRNTEARVREGKFQITLPPRAAISRFAMENTGVWMEAEVVPKMTARRAYDDFLHRKQDPALLEKAAGNQFTAKVFPIPASAEKHLVVSYSQDLPGARYVLPLRGLPRVERLDVTLGRETLSMYDWQPDRDFVSAVETSASAVGAGTWVAAQVEVSAQAKRDVPKGITLLVDTSASRSLGYRTYLATVQKLAGELGDVPLQVVAFDQDSELVYEGRAGGFGAAQIEKLVARGAAGASDLGQALAWIDRHGAKRRVVLVGDGVITAGAEGKELEAIAKRVAAVERFDVVLAGGLRDERAAALLANAGKRAGAVLDAETDRVVHALGESVATNIAIAVPGASWWYPHTIASARSGTHAMVFARMPEARGSIEVIAGGVRRRMAVQPAAAPLVERAIASAQIEEMEGSLASLRGEDAKRVRSAIAKRSVAARVLSRETAMLVLESDGDYARYGIDRKALADVLVVDNTSVAQLHRDHVTTRSDAKPVETDTVDPRAPEPRATPRIVTNDNDHDAILDVDDRCPDQPESFNGMDDDDGCPDRGRVVVTSASIIVLERIQFHANSDAIRPESLSIADEVARVLREYREIELVEIGGHTDERGDDAKNLALSQRRAEAVRRYLVAQGVAPERLEAVGYGEAQPLDRRHDAMGWAKNRRVEFLILRRSPDGKSPSPPPPPAITGPLAEIRSALAANQADVALAKARAWHAREPGDVLALIGLGEALEASHANAQAARAYGSIIDLFPGRADMRRFAGERLGALATELAIDTYRRAVADRPDHLTGHRLLAYAYIRARRPADAFAAIMAGLDIVYRPESFRGGKRVLGEDAAMIGAVYAAAAPAKRAEILAALAAKQLALATRPTTRFVAYWETDANDVDLHVEDAQHHHAYYRDKKLPAGGELYDDVTTGYGPEVFAFAGTPSAGPYKLWLDYYAQGPMGYGMGMVQIQTFDPQRGITLDDRPYIIMTPHARADAGTVP